MKVLLIRPSLNGSPHADALPPLGLAVLAALGRDQARFALYDEMAAGTGGDLPRADLAAMTVSTLTARRAYQLADRLRRQGTPVVLGGFHPSCCPDEAAGHADAVVVGDGEDTWRALLEDAVQGTLQSRYVSRMPALDNTVMPDRSLFEGLGYAGASLVEYARGCPGVCDFCAVHGLYGAVVRRRPVSNVLDDLDACGRDLVIFTDDCFDPDGPDGKRLLDGLAARKMSWACQARLDLARKSEIVRNMARSGCVCVMAGIESIVPENLRTMRKGYTPDAGQLTTWLSVFRDHGIMLYGSFVFGYDDDTPDTFDRTLAFALRQKLFLANFNPLLPMPGTPLLARLRKDGRMRHASWWLDPAYRYGDAVFHPRGMTAEQLAEGCWRLRKAFNRPLNTWRRMFDPRANARSLRNLRMFTAVNAVNRREIMRKQGLSLGSAGPDPGGGAPA